MAQIFKLARMSLSLVAVSYLFRKKTLYQPWFAKCSMGSISAAFLISFSKFKDHSWESTKLHFRYKDSQNVGIFIYLVELFLSPLEPWEYWITFSKFSPAILQSPLDNWKFSDSYDEKLNHSKKIKTAFLCSTNTLKSTKS